jgi:hypothetical protein
MENKKNIQQINIELSQETSEGEYSNFVVVTHSPAEFVLDFTKILPGVTKARVHSRVVMAPQHTKSFLSALKDNIDRYENEHGKIVSPERDGFGEYPQNTPEDSLPN